LSVEAAATVLKKSGKTRKGRGFSREELKEAKLNFHEALRLHLPVDTRRKTKHNENVKALKHLLRKK
jgi:ribosomal protein L13E